jgi:hypothetical protein
MHTNIIQDLGNPYVRHKQFFSSDIMLIFQQILKKNSLLVDNMKWALITL